MDQDQDLLFGVLAVQLEKVSPAQISSVAGDWAADPSRSLPERLQEHRVLSPSDSALIQGFVDRALESHSGDASKALESLGGAQSVEETFNGSMIRTDSFAESLGLEPNPSTLLVEPEEAFGVHESSDRYTHQKEHARGGMGRVLVVHDEFVGRDIALKELLPPFEGSSATTMVPDKPLSASSHFVRRFLQEARITGQLEHPSIVPVYELGQREDGSVYYTMKLVKGKSLSQAIKDAKSLGDRLKLLHHFVDLCQAIAYAHSRGVIHRDIKPTNVMVGAFGETVVIDWGLAKVLGKADIHSERFDDTVQQLSEGVPLEATGTAYGQAVGTPCYMPPEQAKGELDQLDERSDSYSLGAVLYELLTGQPPFMGDDTQAILAKVVADLPTPVRDLAHDTPAELIAICERAMQKNRMRRYPSPKDIAEEVQRFLNGAVVQAYEYSFIEHLRRFLARHRSIVLTGTTALVALIALAVYYNVNLYQSRESERAQLLVSQETNKQLRWTNYAMSLSAAQKNIQEHNFTTALDLLDACPPEHRNWEWGRLRQECEPAFAYHNVNANVSGTMGSVKLSPSGAYLLIQRFFRQGTIQVHDIARDEDVFIAMTGQNFSWPDCVQFLPGEEAFTASLDPQTIGVWSPASSNADTPIATFSSESGEITSVSVSPNGTLLAGFVHNDGLNPEIVVWDFESSDILSRVQLEHVLDEMIGPPWPERHWSRHIHPLQGGVLGFSQDERRLVFFDSHVGSLDISTEELSYLTASGPHVDYSPTSDRIALITPEEQLEIWDLESGSRVRAFEDHSGALTSVALRADGEVVMTSGGGTRIWDVATGTLVYHDGHETEDLSFSDSGNVAVALEKFQDYPRVQFWDSGSFANTHTLLNLSGEGEQVQLLVDYNEVSPYAFDKKSELLLTIDPSIGLRIWKGPAREHVGDWSMDPVDTMAWNPDGTQVATVTKDRITIWDYETRTEVFHHDRRPDVWFMHCAFSPDGKRLLVGASDQSDLTDNGEDLVWVVDIESGEILHHLSEHEGACSYVAYSPDGQWIVTAAFGVQGEEDAISLRIWDADGKPALMGTVNQMGWPWEAVFSSDGTKLATVGQSRELILYDLTTHKEVYRAKSGHARRAVFLPDGERIAMIRSGGFAIHAVEDGRELISYPYGLAPLTFFEDGQKISISQGYWRTRILGTMDWRDFSYEEHLAERMQRVRAMLGLS